jgi:hypothetical protein
MHAAINELGREEVARIAKEAYPTLRGAKLDAIARWLIGQAHSPDIAAKELTAICKGQAPSLSGAFFVRVATKCKVTHSSVETCASQAIDLAR